MAIMNLTLTEEQQRAIDTQSGVGPRLIDPRTKAAYILVPETEYEEVREVIEEERRQKVIREIALRNVIKAIVIESDCEPI